MTRTASQTDPSGGLNALVVLAIGLQLMLSGATLAAGACGDSLERVGVRRLSEQVVQAIREISDRSSVRTGTPQAEPDWTEAPRAMWAQPAVLVSDSRDLPVWIHALPPPAAA